MPGTLIPPWYDYNEPSTHETAVASVVWGLSLGLTAFGAIRASDQSLAHWRRTRRVTPYIVYIWLELVASTIIGGIAWGYVRLYIPPSLWYFTGMSESCFPPHLKPLLLEKNKGWWSKCCVFDTNSWLSLPLVHPSPLHPANHHHAYCPPRH